MSANEITVSMGKPITAPCLIPVLHASTPACINDPFMINGKKYGVTALSFGTPHGAVVVDDVDSVDVPSLGAALGKHVLFPEGASIVFIQALDRESIKVRLWQRGTGETPFTREAACVAGTAALMLQMCIAGGVKVVMGGNTVHAEWNWVQEDVFIGGHPAQTKTDWVREIKLTGPAELLSA